MVKPARVDCNDCRRTVYSPHWASVGFRDPATGQWDRWYLTLWFCPETFEGFTVYCHHCQLIAALTEAEAELRAAREYHSIRRTAALNAWAAREEQQLELRDQFRQQVAQELAG